jgi:hypothetical protein
MGGLHTPHSQTTTKQYSTNLAEPHEKLLKTNTNKSLATWIDGKKSRSKYYLQDCCWDTSYMSEAAMRFRYKTAVCIECGELLDNGGYGMGRLGAVHWGCGGMVIKARRENPREIKG